MHAPILFTAIALLPFAFAAPQGPPRGPPFRNTESTKVRQNGPTTTPDPPSCDLSRVTQPASALAPPAAGLSLVLVALGDGTQNYTCGTNTTTAPIAIGALAQFYNASCALSKNPSASTASLGSIENSPAVGKHFFVDTTTPDFDIMGLGNTQAKKVQQVPSPQPSENVMWVKLQAQAESTGNVKEVYRLSTVGGLAPSSCEGKAEGDVVTVAYKAQYWFYA